VKALAIDINSVRSICNQYKLDHRVACTNLVSLLETVKPADETEKVDITTAMSQVGCPMPISPLSACKPSSSNIPEHALYGFPVDIDPRNVPPGVRNVISVSG
jgi:hypothetical protein